MGAHRNPWSLYFQRSQSAVHNQPEVSLRWLCTAVASGCVGCGFVVQPLYNYAKTPN